jgi:hypothetical protein
MDKLELETPSKQELESVGSGGQSLNSSFGAAKKDRFDYTPLATAGSSEMQSLESQVSAPGSGSGGGSMTGRPTNPFLESGSVDNNVIHVLPESIVNGALNAAAHVLQHASRALFPTNEAAHDADYNWQAGAGGVTSEISDDAVSATGVATRTQPTDVAVVSPMSAALADPMMRSQMLQLFEMGFWNKELNKRLLSMNNMDVSSTVEELLAPREQQEVADGQRVVSSQPVAAARQPNSAAADSSYICEFD